MKSGLKNHRATRIVFGLLALMLLAVSGCQSLHFLSYSQPQAPVTFETVPDKNQLIAAIHRNTAAVKQLDSSVKVSMDGMPAVSGTLLLERPRRMRLKVGFLGITESGLDVGSNDEVFWIWNKSSIGNQSPTIYFARHEEYLNSPLQSSLQLRPQWIVNALGLVEFDPTKPIEGPFRRNDGRYEIRTYIEKGGGVMRTVIDPRYGWIVQQSVYDAQNRLVVWANSKNHRYYPEHNASLPQHVELHVYDASGQEMTMTVRLLSHEINALYGDPTKIWAMPMPADVPQIDLSKISFQSNPSLSEPRGEPSDKSIEFAHSKPWTRPKLRGFDAR